MISNIEPSEEMKKHADKINDETINLHSTIRAGGLNLFSTINIDKDRSVFGGGEGLL